MKNNHDIIKIQKFAIFAFLIFFISLAFDMTPVILSLAIVNFDVWDFLKPIIYIGSLIHVLISGWMMGVANKLISHELATKYHLTLWATLSFFLPWVFVWFFRYNLSRAFFEAQTNPEYLDTIKWWTCKKSIRDAETNDTLVLQFNSVDEKLTQLDKLYKDGLIKEEEYEKLKSIIINDDYPHA